MRSNVSKVEAGFSRVEDCFSSVRDDFSGVRGRFSGRKGRFSAVRGDLNRVGDGFSERGGLASGGKRAVCASVVEVAVGRWRVCLSDVGGL